MRWDGTVRDADRIIEAARAAGCKAGWGYRYIGDAYTATIRVETPDGPVSLTAGDSIDIDGLGYSADSLFGGAA